MNSGDLSFRGINNGSRSIWGKFAFNLIPNPADAFPRTGGQAPDPKTLRALAAPSTSTLNPLSTLSFSANHRFDDLTVIKHSPKQPDARTKQEKWGKNWGELDARLKAVSDFIPGDARFISFTKEADLELIPGDNEALEFKFTGNRYKRRTHKSFLKTLNSVIPDVFEANNYKQLAPSLRFFNTNKNGVNFYGFGAEVKDQGFTYSLPYIGLVSSKDQGEYLVKFGIEKQGHPKAYVSSIGIQTSGPKNEKQLEWYPLTEGDSSLSADHLKHIYLTLKTLKDFDDQKINALAQISDELVDNEKFHSSMQSLDEASPTIKELEGRLSSYMDAKILERYSEAITGLGSKPYAGRVASHNTFSQVYSLGSSSIQPRYNIFTDDNGERFYSKVIKENDRTSTSAIAIPFLGDNTDDTVEVVLGNSDQATINLQNIQMLSEYEAAYTDILKSKQARTYKPLPIVRKKAEVPQSKAPTAPTLTRWHFYPHPQAGSIGTNKLNSLQTLSSSLLSRELDTKFSFYCDGKIGNQIYKITKGEYSVKDLTVTVYSRLKENLPYGAALIVVNQSNTPAEVFYANFGKLDYPRASSEPTRLLSIAIPRKLNPSSYEEYGCDAHSAQALDASDMSDLIHAVDLAKDQKRIRTIKEFSKWHNSENKEETSQGENLIKLGYSFLNLQSVNLSAWRYHFGKEIFKGKNQNNQTIYCYSKSGLPTGLALVEIKEDGQAPQRILFNYDRLNAQAEVQYPKSAALISYDKDGSLHLEEFMLESDADPIHDSISLADALDFTEAVSKYLDGEEALRITSDPNNNQILHEAMPKEYKGFFENIDFVDNRDEELCSDVNEPNYINYAFRWKQPRIESNFSKQISLGHQLAREFPSDMKSRAAIFQSNGTNRFILDDQTLIVSDACRAGFQTSPLYLVKWHNDDISFEGYAGGYPSSGKFALIPLFGILSETKNPDDFFLASFRSHGEKISSGTFVRPKLTSVGIHDTEDNKINVYRVLNEDKHLAPSTEDFKLMAASIERGFAFEDYLGIRKTEEAKQISALQKIASRFFDGRANFRDFKSLNNMRNHADKNMKLELSYLLGKNGYQCVQERDSIEYYCNDNNLDLYAGKLDNLNCFGLMHKALTDSGEILPDALILEGPNGEIFYLKYTFDLSQKQSELKLGYIKNNPRREISIKDKALKLGDKSPTDQDHLASKSLFNKLLRHKLGYEYLAGASAYNTAA